MTPEPQNTFQGLELHATVLRRNPNRNYSADEIEFSNILLKRYCDSTSEEGKKNLRVYLKQKFDAEIEELGCIADHEGKSNHSNLKLAKWFGRLRG